MLRSLKTVKRSALPSWQRGKFIARRATARLRVLPNLYLIGAGKCATTSLAASIVAHPDVLAGLKKEPHYFNLNRGAGQELWYRSHFPLSATVALRRRLRSREPVIGDYTPSSYYCPHAAEQISSLGGQPKIIISLRNPVDRAHSMYRHWYKMGSTDLSFEQAIERERELVGAEYEKMVRDPSYQSRVFFNNAFLERGKYIEFIPRWVDTFGRESILFLRFEDLVGETDTTFRRVCRFLEIEELSLPHYPREDPSAWSESLDVQRTPLQLCQSTRERLQQYFAPYNERLGEYLGWELGWD